MSHSKVHSQERVPFSWENKPGVSKVTHHECPTDQMERRLTLKLPPPPCPSDSPKVLVHDLHIPLPPCPFLSSSSSSRKVLRRQDDPFLEAYKECTKSVGNGKRPKDSKKEVRKNKFVFSCKNSCEVRDDNLVRFSNLHHVSREKLSESR